MFSKRHKRFLRSFHFNKTTIILEDWLLSRSAGKAISNVKGLNQPADGPIVELDQLGMMG
jgi:hypothetical protein